MSQKRRVREFSEIGKSSSKELFPAPQQISIHHNTQKRKFVPQKHHKWMEISFLWKDEEDEKPDGTNEEFDFAKELK